ncbi:hypothetical protein [Streptosporangium nondiastaticum]|uniref:hypothetical protein n=1 Tax=Streptosporangium nondiastaticum TaxID=35764 RepID=UPI001CB98833|nr:hypothetical protein [Streptosporangium nondiastaticum]
MFTIGDSARHGRVAGRMLRHDEDRPDDPDQLPDGARPWMRRITASTIGAASRPRYAPELMTRNETGTHRPAGMR